MTTKIRSLSNIAVDWAIRCFGREHVFNKHVRALRLVEEAVELAQVVDVPPEQLHELIDIVYGRKKGELYRELGGVMLTTIILHRTLELDPEDMLEAELRRVLYNSAKHFAKRNQEKIDMGLTG